MVTRVSTLCFKKVTGHIMNQFKAHVSGNLDGKGNLFVRKGQELALSGRALAELLCAVFEKGGQFRLKAKGGSMSPIIKDGDVVTVSPLNGTANCVGDVVAFANPSTGRLVIHRIVGKNGAHCLLKGDNTCKVDGVLANECILGRVIRIERDGKRRFIGLGPERVIFAWFSRLRFLRPLLGKISRVMPNFVRSLVS